MSAEIITVPVPLKNSPYEILIGSGILTRTGELASKVVKPCRCVVISDEVVAALHAAGVLESLRISGFEPHLLTVPTGEASKSMIVAADLPTDAILVALARDKKFDAGAIRFVLTSKLGTAFVSDKVTLDDVSKAIGRLS